MIKKIAVVGRDVDAWMSALLLQLSLGKAQTDIEVQLIELPSRLGKQDVITSEPSLRAFHDLLGLSDTKLLEASHGTISLGQRYTGWSGGSSDFMHVFDSSGAPVDGVEFFQCWIKAIGEGLNVKLEEFSLGAAAAKRGKIIALSPEGSSYSQASYGYHLSAIDYLKTIASIAVSVGVKHCPAEIEEVKCREGEIDSLILASGMTVEADLFIDASGFPGELISKVSNERVECWNEFFPFTRQVVANAEVLDPLPSFSQHTAWSSGYISIYPLSNRTSVNLFSNPHSLDVKKAPQIVVEATGISIQELLVRDRSTGLRRRAWVGNCVAVGESVAAVDPIESVQPYLLHAALSYLITLLPISACVDSESRLYNDKMCLHAENIRDFQLCHYYLNSREDKSWRVLRDVTIPASLEEKLNLYKVRGKVLPRECELFGSSSWQLLLSGMGLIPQTYNPLVDGVDDKRLIQQFQNMLKFTAAESENMPDLQTYLEMHSTASPVGAIF